MPDFPVDLRTIGILGGIGPQATMDLEARIHRVAQRKIPQHANTGYPPLVSVFLRHAPVAVGDDGKPTSPLTLDPRLLDAARKLGEWADVIAIPSNTPHFFLDEIAEAAGCEVLDMVGATVDALKARQVDAVGLVGLGVPKVYRERLEAAGIRAIVADDARRTALDDAILALMEGAEGDRGAASALAAVDQVRAAGAAVTVLGCTEIPLLMGDGAEAPDLVNPAQLLAEAAVEAAMRGG